jgi:hypothetical protein
MATITKVLVQNTLAAATATSEYTSAANERSFIGKPLFTNTSASNVQVTVWILDSSETATDGSGGNYVEKLTIPPYSSKIFDKLIGLIVERSGNITIKADTANVVNVNIHGASEAV